MWQSPVIGSLPPSYHVMLYRPRVTVGHTRPRPIATTIVCCMSSVVTVAGVNSCYVPSRRVALVRHEYERVTYGSNTSAVEATAHMAMSDLSESVLTEMACFDVCLP